MTGRAALLAAAALMAGGPASADPIILHVSEVPLIADDPAHRAVGRLVYRGGLSLASTDPRFGGFSGLSVDNDGRRLVAVSDKGHWLSAALRYDAGGRLVGAGAGELFPVRDLTGAEVRRKRLSDAEALERVSGSLVVAFEHRHRLWVYRDRAGAEPSRAMAESRLPAKAATAASIGRNQGIEALAMLPGGRLLALAEGKNDETPLRPGWVVADGRWLPLRYRRAAGFRPTGAATLPSGNLLVLERRFSWISGIAARIVRVPSAAIRPGVVVAGVEIGRLHEPMTVDNFEGIATRRDGQGRTLVYLISDDNFHILQRTLLLMFELTGEQ